VIAWRLNHRCTSRLSMLVARRKPAAFTLIALFVFAEYIFAGCTTAEPEIPDGFTRVSTAGISFGYPSDWNKVPKDSLPHGWAFMAQSSRGNQIGVLTNLPKRVDADEASEAAVVGVESNTHGFRQGRTSTIEVPNADSAHRMEFSYDAVVNGKLVGQRAHGTDIATIDGAGKAVVVRISGLESRLSEGMVNQIVRTLAVDS
jgi:hypothetical protein